MAGAGAVIGQFVAGKAARDALFLSRFDVTSLPVMVMAGSVFSILVALAMSRAMSRVAPSRLLPYVFILSAGLLIGVWAIGSIQPRLGAVLFYLHMLGLGPALVSGFWSILNEQTDPRTAKRHFGQIAAAATAGGLGGSFLAERVGAAASIDSVLPVLAAANVLCSWIVYLVVRNAPAAPVHRVLSAARPGLAAPRRMEALRKNVYLRNIAALVLLTTVGGTLLDYVFKATAVETFGRGDGLLRFFALYYGATNLLTFTSQISFSRLVLERLGLGPAVGSPAVAIAGGSLSSLLLPGLPVVTAARGAEYVGRMSLFRSAYELLYTPVSAAHKRAAKPVIDIGVDRLGDLAGGAATRLVVLLAPAAVARSVILTGAILASLLALVVARRLTGGYVQTLERSLLSQAVRLDFADVEDLTTRATIVRTLEAAKRPSAAAHGAGPRPVDTALKLVDDPIVRQLMDLRSRDRDRVLGVLRQEDPLDWRLVPHAIDLLAWDQVAPDAIFALKRVAEPSVGQLVDSLLNPAQDFSVRRRIPRVMSICVSQRAADGLLAALDDRFEVRFRSGQALAAIVDRNPRVRVDRDRVIEVVLREVGVSRTVWESHRLLDGSGDGGFFLDDFVRDRAGQSLAHVFTLLSLALSREPLQIAFRGLQVDDPFLRGTSLEYLESVLPTAVRERLWPFLEDARPGERHTRSREEILADLVRSNDSITLNLRELRLRQLGHRQEPAEDATARAAGAQSARSGAG